MSEPNTSDYRKWEEGYKIEYKRHEIIEKLENGFERYQVDALTHSVVESLARGTDPIKVIDDILKRLSSMRIAYQKTIEYFGHPQAAFTVSADALENLLKTIKK